ncbi:MAG TPA: hypothetical protein DCQ98_14145 [Planctomycetaceae bacterium]|nr:hypothetical protein [Planctomycetaceae bacterium]HRE99732.1 hypothetical protein [Pirellulaceae bacterium]
MSESVSGTVRSRSGPPTDAQLDRLVDGEVSPAEYRDIVSALERHPECWRRVAELFLESQALQRDLAGCFAPEAPMLESLLNESRSDDADTLRRAGDRAEADDDWSDSRVEPARPRMADRSWRDWAAPAVSLAVIAVAFLAGRQASSISSPSPQPGASGLAETQPASFVPAGHLRLAVDDLDQNVAVPYFDPQTYNAFVKRTPADAPIESLLPSGTKVDRVRAVMPESLDADREVLVPVEMISIPGMGEFQ